jgi:hypothetical protein
VARPALLRRLPRLRWREPTVWPPVPPEQYARYPTLADELALLEEHLLPAFVDLDRGAQREQNRFRRQQVLIFVGGFAATVFGAVQAALGEASWPGLLVAVTGAAVGSLTFAAHRRGSQHKYLHARLRTERLRSLYFCFLARAGPFAEDEHRTRTLIRSVEAIKNPPERP